MSDDDVEIKGGETLKDYKGKEFSRVTQVMKGAAIEDKEAAERWIRFQMGRVIEEKMPLKMTWVEDMGHGQPGRMGQVFLLMGEEEQQFHFYTTEKGREFVLAHPHSVELNPPKGEENGQA